MGYGEFGGGGSVWWEVVNSDGESGSGDKNKCKGKDKDPKTGGWFVVSVNDRARIVERVKNTKVRVEWVSESAALPAAGPSPARSAAPKKAKKASR